YDSGLIALARGTGKIVVDHVTRRLNALLARVKWALRGLTFAKTPLSAISRLTWSPEASEVRRVFKAPPERRLFVPTWIWSSGPQLASRTSKREKPTSQQNQI